MLRCIFYTTHKSTYIFMRVWYNGCALAFQANEDGFDSHYPLQLFSCLLAQLVEHSTDNRAVAGSSPAQTTKFLMRISVMVTHGTHNPKFTVQVRGSQPKKCECITSINGKQHRLSFRVMFYTFTIKKKILKNI